MVALNPEVLVDLAYEAAMLPERWPGVLEQIASHVGAHAGALVTVDHRQQTRHVTSPGYEKTYRDFSLSGMDYENRRTIRHLAMNHAGFLLDLDTCTQAELDTDPIYENFLYPHGLGWTVGTLIPVPTSEMLVFDFCSTLRQGPMGRSAVQSLDGLRPHLARAALLTTRLAHRAAELRVETLEAIGIAAAVLTSPKGRVIAANSLFAEMAENVFVGRDDLLKARDARVASAISRALMTETSAVSLPLQMQASRPAEILHLIPIKGGAREVFSGAQAIVIVTPLRARGAPPIELLNGLFDLSPAEAKVAFFLADGLTLTQLALKMEVSRETVRTHLKSVFAKTGTSRQAELVRLLCGVTVRGR